jgi:integral membrane protein (TIGR00529 family)
MLPVLGVLLAFAVIVVLRLRNVDFSLSILTGSLILAVTSEAPVEVLVEAGRLTITDPNTMNLAVAVALITVLGYSLKETSLMTELIEGLRGVLPARVLLATIPAMFGLLTMPGGALMSAPFNEPEADRLGLKPEQKTYINVWFRHLWYWASPLSPVAILAASLAGFTLNGFLGAQLPILAVTVALGFLVGSTFIKDGGRSSHGEKGLPEVARGLAPIVLAVVLSAVGVPIWMALALAVALVFIIRKVPPGKAFNMIHSGVRWDLAAAVVSMLFFRFVVESSGSVEALFESATELGVPLIAILIVVPLLVGSISGTPTMGIGIIFPLLLPLLGDYNVYVVSIIYAGLIGGYLASPMHLCLILTNSYYRSELGRVYRYLVPSAAFLYVFAVSYYLFMNGAIPV